MFDAAQGENDSAVVLKNWGTIGTAGMLEIMKGNKRQREEMLGTGSPLPSFIDVSEVYTPVFWPRHNKLSSR